jgi:hypothetical protein
LLAATFAVSLKPAAAICAALRIGVAVPVVLSLSVGITPFAPPLVVTLAVTLMMLASFTAFLKPRVFFTAVLRTDDYLPTLSGH